MKNMYKRKRALGIDEATPSDDIKCDEYNKKRREKELLIKTHSSSFTPALLNSTTESRRRGYRDPVQYTARSQLRAPGRRSRGVPGGKGKRNFRAQSVQRAGGGARPSLRATVLIIPL
ncbi:hypothetical protein EVAR_19403_1 [Eumeta japonica]|uniref:Uncharacterized protein n=1 Tax=Eumeta variegata TaxID=151549 RepID=A0A4C1TRI8_EUMVA|nr:hypothetical protein EVAR_19403_1 [Eumeta japonica]